MGREYSTEPAAVPKPALRLIEFPVASIPMRPKDCCAAPPKSVGTPVMLLSYPMPSSAQPRQPGVVCRLRDSIASR